MSNREETRVDAKLNVLIRHLVLSFPQAAILSRAVGERYYVCVIVPHDGSSEKALQVERGLLHESGGSIEEFERYLFQLNLPLIFQTRERYELTSAHAPRPGEGGPNPSNEGWSGELLSATEYHGPFPLSDPSSSTPADALPPASSA